ncbi:hypothetical protein B0T18DRAFT_242264 [Schizothecium vesticola]|uniref:Uncharacterized protein n=1 Tax=Schizothecium vesticola TaxID=314040 RepID=A0AA40BQ23_9PEZI|nr:hypothetical protein B0T18DRAFT_242264 [Schizothecium vesticola]
MGWSFLGFSGPKASNMNAWRLAPSGRQAGVDHPSSPQRLWPPSRKLPSRCLVVCAAPGPRETPARAALF